MPAAMSKPIPTSHSGRPASSTSAICGAWRKRRLPRAVFDYLDGGAEGEVTLRENCAAFEDVKFRPRHAVAVPQCDLRTQVLGAELSFPAILAPIGYSRMMHPDGECAAARGAGAAGIAYILSTISGHKLEDVRAAIHRARSGTSSIWSADARLRKPRWIAPRARGLFGSGRHDRHGDGRDARARHPKRHRATHERQPAGHASLSSAISCPGPDGWQLS